MAKLRHIVVVHDFNPTMKQAIPRTVAVGAFRSFNAAIERANTIERVLDDKVIALPALLLPGDTAAHVVERTFWPTES